MSPLTAVKNQIPMGKSEVNRFKKRTILAIGGYVERAYPLEHGHGSTPPPPPPLIYFRCRVHTTDRWHQVQNLTIGYNGVTSFPSLQLRSMYYTAIWVLKAIWQHEASVLIFERTTRQKKNSNNMQIYIYIYAIVCEQLNPPPSIRTS